MLKEYDDMKEEIKNLKASKVNQTMLSNCLKCKKITDSKNPMFPNTNKYFIKICSVRYYKIKIFQRTRS